MLFNQAIRIKFIIITFFLVSFLFLLVYCRSHKTRKRQKMQILSAFIFSVSLETPSSDQIRSDQSLNLVRLFSTP